MAKIDSIEKDHGKERAIEADHAGIENRNIVEFVYPRNEWGVTEPFIFSSERQQEEKAAPSSQTENSPSTAPPSNDQAASKDSAKSQSIDEIWMAHSAKKNNKKHTDADSGNTKANEADPQGKKEDSKETVVTNATAQEISKAATTSTDAMEDSNDSDSDSDCSEISSSSAPSSSSDENDDSIHSNSLTIQTLENSDKADPVPKDVSTTTDQFKSTQPSKKANKQARPKPKSVIVDRGPQHGSLEVIMNNIQRKKNNPWQEQELPMYKKTQNGTHDLLGHVQVDTWDDDDKEDNPNAQIRKAALDQMAQTERVRKRKQRLDRWDSALDEGKLKKVKTTDKVKTNTIRMDPKDNPFHKIQSSMQIKAKGQIKGYTPSKTTNKNGKGGRDGKKGGAPKGNLKNRGKGKRR